MPKVGGSFYVWATRLPTYAPEPGNPHRYKAHYPEHNTVSKVRLPLQPEGYAFHRQAMRLQQMNPALGENHKSVQTNGTQFPVPE
jgi:hypothetical protein